MPRRSSGSVRLFYPRWTREELIALLRRRVSALAEETPVKKAYLFGSWAKGNATVASDVDLLVVCAGPADAEAFRAIRKSIEVRGLELHLYSEEDYERSQSVVERMVRDAVAIYP